MLLSFLAKIDRLWKHSYLFCPINEIQGCSLRDYGAVLSFLLKILTLLNSIIVRINEKGGETDCNNYSGILFCQLHTKLYPTSRCQH